MTDVIQPTGNMVAKDHHRELGLKGRYAAEFRFRAYGILAISLGILFLFILFWSIVSKGYTAFEQSKIRLDLYLNEQIIDPAGNRERRELQKAIRYNKIILPALYKTLGLDPQDKSKKADLKAAKNILSKGAAIEIRDMVLDDPDLIGTRVTAWLLASGDADSFVKGQISRETPEKNRQVSDKEIAFIDDLQERGIMDGKFNTGLFTYGASLPSRDCGYRCGCSWLSLHDADRAGPCPADWGGCLYLS